MKHPRAVRGPFEQDARNFRAAMIRLLRNAGFMRLRAWLLRHPVVLFALIGFMVAIGAIGEMLRT